MREIKFRSWNEEQKHMLRPELLALGWTVEKLNDSTNVVMQYTGLKDKNGKEIYEGDVVSGVIEYPRLLTSDCDENCNFKMCGEVFYDHSGFSLKCVQAKCDPERDGMVNYFDFIGKDGERFTDMQVIGNVHQNPELLN